MTDKTDEAVAWQVKDFADGWILCHTKAEAGREAAGCGNLVQPLFHASSLASRDARIAELEKDVRDWQAIAADRQAGHSLAEARALKAEALLSDQPRPSVSEDQGSSRDHALTDGVALDGWQPIETAPKDGTRFLSLAWDAKFRRWSQSVSTYWWRGKNQGSGGWVFDHWSTLPEPSHWMPLPAPPSSARQTPDAVPGTN